MKFLFSICFFLLGSFYLSDNNQLPKNSPKHLAIDIDWKSIAQTEDVFQFSNLDTTITHQVQLLRNEDGLPLVYYADILTPVCIDGICKPVYVELYWDLLGQYAGYGEYPDKLLSKYDHENFESADYLKLHELLNNKNSILGKRRLSALYDISQEREVKITFRGQEIDGVSGATKKEIKTAIVEGALYSCYTLWQMSYGEVTLKIKDLVPELYSDSLEKYFLKSDHEAYNMYALKNLEKEKFGENINQLSAIIANGKPLTRSYALKKMPKNLFAHQMVVDKLYRNLASLDFNARTLLINNLKSSNQHAFLALSNQLNVLSKNQLKSYLKQLKETQNYQSKVLLENLNVASADTSFGYAHLIKAFIESIN